MIQSIHNNDEALWLSFKQGNQQSFERIYSLYSHELIRYGLKLCSDSAIVEDCLHDLFIELWNGREHLADVVVIRYYLIRSMRYKLMKSLKLSYQISPLQDDFEWASDQLSLKQDSDSTQEQRIQKAVNELPLRQKEVIYLRFYLGYSLKQMSDLLDINHQSVSNLLHRAITSLKQKGLWTYCVILLFTLIFNIKSILKSIISMTRI